MIEQSGFGSPEKTKLSPRESAFKKHMKREFKSGENSRIRNYIVPDRFLVVNEERSTKKSSLIERIYFGQKTEELGQTEPFIHRADIVFKKGTDVKPDFVSVSKMGEANQGICFRFFGDRSVIELYDLESILEYWYSQDGKLDNIRYLSVGRSDNKRWDGSYYPVVGTKYKIGPDIAESLEIELEEAEQDVLLKWQTGGNTTGMRVPCKIDPEKIINQLCSPALLEDPYNASPHEDTGWLHADLKNVVGIRPIFLDN